MRFSSHVRDPGPTHGKKGAASFLARVCLSALPCLTFVSSFAVQDVGSEEKEYYGSGSVITVKVHDASGEAFPSSAVVKLFRGAVPSGQRDTSSGVAEFVVNRTGEFMVVVAAPGYSEVQKDVSVPVTGRTQVDVCLRSTLPASIVAGVPGRPVLTPKAKKALDQGIVALKENRVGEAEKYVGDAMRMAPGNPDVLYLQGVLSLKQRNWAQAQTVLEKATQIDPNSARAFAALGMALCDAGKYDAAISPLEKSLQLDRAGTWQTRWALAKSYYHGQRFEEALKLSQEALAQSRGDGPEIALLAAQSLTAVGRYEDSAEILREFLRDHADRTEAALARRWLEQLAANGKIGAN
jgi:thioredoxin-like negative regulator of GroEL